MDINGCQVVSEPSDKTKEGFLSTVHRDGMTRGPFEKISDATKCAREWSQEPEPAAPPEPPKEPPRQTKKKQNEIE
jgi:hypothetical protein